MYSAAISLNDVYAGDVAGGNVASNNDMLVPFQDSSNTTSYVWMLRKCFADIKKYPSF